VRSISISPSPRCGPYLPFYSFQGEGSGYIYGKKEKGEKMKEKNKNMVSGVVIFLLIQREQFTP
jgi:hypothetical protein